MYFFTQSGDGIRQRGRREQAGASRVHAADAAAAQVRLDRQPALLVLHLLHVRQHRHAQSIEKVFCLFVKKIFILTRENCINC